MRYYPSVYLHSKSILQSKIGSNICKRYVRGWYLHLKLSIGAVHSRESFCIFGLNIINTTEHKSMDTPHELFSPEDIKQLHEQGISLEEAEQQVEDIRSGFPYLNIQAAASLQRGIVRLSREEEAYYMGAWQDYLSKPEADVCKMVPASGAASRMFKELFAFVESESEEPNTPTVERFFADLSHFAFYESLGRTCLRTKWKSITSLLENKEYKALVDALLSEKGMGYGHLPKGMLLFHNYPKGPCTAAEEHLVEGAMYARHTDGKVAVHFTVSPEHRNLFETTLQTASPYFEEKYGVYFQLSYSEQQACTDTLALTPEGELFRRNDGRLLFRPGGHGALINNLGALDADVVFIKNIDNVVPDHLKAETIMYKKLLAGVLVKVREQIYKYAQLLDGGKATASQLAEICDFFRKTLCIDIPESLEQDETALEAWLQKKLDRPIRVCGMVRNQGEPGGGPFIIKEADGSTSLQILESSQINMSDETQRKHFETASYFNPVDLVCSLRNHRGESYDLSQFVNPKTAFLASKSQNGRALKALERPGLWNGAMHHWTTIFVDVPVETFNPVKEVNDLLRSEHQSK